MTLSNRQFVQTFFASTALYALPAQAIAQEQQSYNFDLPAQELGDMLRAIAARGDLQVYAAAEDLKGKGAAALQGRFTVREAVERAVRGSGLIASFDGDSIIIKSSAKGLGKSVQTTEEPTIIVTGTRIKGAPPVVPVTVITAVQIKQAGQSDLGEVARSLPQSFGGGQNPGVGNTQGNGNENTNANGASTFNLRGIGPNATLTLLNGNRFGYTGVSAAIDVSAIPVAAVQRVEIVADGSSAIYGADAVAGVVNIILKPSYEGITASARIGGSTDGGNRQQQYNMLAGTSWDTGNILATYDFFHNSTIKAGDRSYASSTNPDASLYPELNRHSFLLSGHQDFGDDVTFSADLIFKTGTMRIDTGYSLDLPINSQGVEARTAFETFGIAPAVSVDLSDNWTAKLSGFYGYDNTDGTGRQYFGGSLFNNSIRQYDNENHSLEIGLEGSLLDLPAGPLRVAAGGGFRSYHFAADTGDSAFEKRRKNYFAYGEIYVPLVDPSQSSNLFRSAALTGAVRFEDYSDSGRIIVPKIGLSIEPFEAVRLSASWGKSFKLPTLFQQYSGYAAVLVGVSGYGTTFPAGSTYIIALGPNAEVGPERSENWTLSATVKPLMGLEIGVSYFNIDYADRVAPPLSSSAGALTNPIYSQIVTINPTVPQQSSLIASALGGLQNATAGVYDPARVVAILDARDRNIARQAYKGVDLSVSYTVQKVGGNQFALFGGATWLTSEQQLLPGLPVTQLSGTIFNSPKFRARSGVTFNSDRISVGAFANHIGGVTDNRRLIPADVRAITSFDLTGGFKIDSHFELALNILNIFNKKPQAVFTTSAFDTPFDTTNYSAVGRFIGITASGKW